MRKPAGFTLLEVVVAMAILSLALMAIFRLNSGAVAMHSYTKRLTVATLLARSKMTDLQQELFDKGFNVDDEDKSGDFTDEGWNSFKWRARILAPKTQGLSPEQLISALFGVPLDGKGGLGGLFGLAGLDAGIPNTSGGPTMGLAPGASMPTGLAALGPMGALMQGPLQQMTDQLTQAVREIRLSVSWKNGKDTDTVDLVTHVVSLGQGSDRNGQNSTGTDGGVPTVPLTTSTNTTGNPLLGAPALPTGTAVTPPVTH